MKSITLIDAQKGEEKAHTGANADFNISNDAGRVKRFEIQVFMISYTRITSAQTHWFPSIE